MIRVRRDAHMEGLVGVLMPVRVLVMVRVMRGEWVALEGWRQPAQAYSAPQHA